jgi:hypothetical protein
LLASFLNNALDEQPEAALQRTPPNLIFFIGGFPVSSVCSFDVSCDASLNAPFNEL